MITQLNWHGCTSNSKWEDRIRQTLADFAELRSVSKAVVDVDRPAEGDTPFRLSMALSIPGPDILATSAGQTFDEALLKLVTKVRKSLSTKASNVQRFSGASRGVKPAFRG